LDPESARFRPTDDSRQSSPGRTRKVSDDRHLGAERQRGFRTDERSAHADVDENAADRTLLRSLDGDRKVYRDAWVAALVLHGYTLLYASTAASGSLEMVRAESCRATDLSVKVRELAGSEKGSSKPFFWQRHLEGWQVLLVVGAIALGAALLAVPRAVAPRELPLPRVDRAELSRFERVEADRLTRAKTTPLPFLVRAAGDAFRRFGTAEAGPSDAATVEARRSDFVEAIAAARKRHGDELVLELRAAQTALFVRALERLDGGGTANRETLELGGAFVLRGREMGWIDGDRMRLEADEAACAFRIRWNELAGVLATRPFSPSLEEWRLYYRTLLGHAPAGTPELSNYVDALVEHDSEYPALLARGIIAYWDNRFGDATELFAQHLAQHPTGAWRLRAQNYLLAAYERAPKS
jgi:hypothetical protein